MITQDADKLLLVSLTKDIDKEQSMCFFVSPLVGQFVKSWIKEKDKEQSICFLVSPLVDHKLGP